MAGVRGATDAALHEKHQLWRKAGRGASGGPLKDIAVTERRAPAARAGNTTLRIPACGAEDFTLWNNGANLKCSRRRARRPSPRTPLRLVIKNAYEAH